MRRAILVAIAAFAAIWHNGSRGFGAIALALFIDAAILAYPAYLAVLYQRLPAIHDISTDVIDPPRFEVLARLRAGDGANPAAYAGLVQSREWNGFTPAGGWAYSRRFRNSGD